LTTPAQRRRWIAPLVSGAERGHVGDRGYGDHREVGVRLRGRVPVDWVDLIGICFKHSVVARDFPDLTIRLMTGYADQRERAQGLEAIVHDVIAKPFSVATLRSAVNEALVVKVRS